MLPNAHRAFIEPAKVRDYLLSPAHPVGRFKANVFRALGYTLDNWQVLHADLLTLAREGEVQPGHDSAHGVKFEVSGKLRGPSGREGAFTTVWLVRWQEDFPRFVTAMPR